MAMANAEAHRQEWLNKTPGARDHIAKLGAFHHAALKAGLADTSPEYFQFLETQLAALKAAPPSPPQPTPQFQPPPAAKPPKPLYGAPVSREVPTSNGSRPTGKVTLSPAEVEAARISGISAEEYAKEKLRYRNMLQSGEYRDNRGEGG
jgi:hypothetical protein